MFISHLTIIILYLSVYRCPLKYTFVDSHIFSVSRTTVLSMYIYTRWLRGLTLQRTSQAGSLVLRPRHRLETLTEMNPASSEKSYDGHVAVQLFLPAQSSLQYELPSQAISVFLRQLESLPAELLQLPYLPEVL